MECIMATSHPHKKWMSETLYMDNLSIGDVVWPGTHNAGVDYDFSYPYLTLGENWFVCQRGPFIQQLNEGARALDLRFYSNEHWVGVKKFETFHGPATGRSLSELIRTLNFFLDENPDEFILLDMHELMGTKRQSFDFK